MEYTVVIHPSEEGGYWVEVPALLGCYSQGETAEEAMVNARESIESHLMALNEDKQPIPKEEGFMFGRVAIAA
ncbi:HicB family protein [Candidatus Desantisbacteria bacterium CG_4_9_14_3_um_filter_40_11]|uniref:HicB family protein n=2 Tax=unclassified Candidatus Desantisiibacteriota TaxID=3106372 RepID=A0A2M8ATG8_9BACT|nr:MAG: HicB family protein [Candidatus Desantisbacteria bacterium CG23_combo_of_CG06-09_8_20_14_all_40_23]PJB29464.1 MAG: HicB family protein [Candidatus Desantisbacteria bacterium CG_4_9_14_3_um_filter_40_11]